MAINYSWYCFIALPLDKHTKYCINLVPCFNTRKIGTMVNYCGVFITLALTSNIIKPFIMVIYYYSMVIKSFCVIKLYYLSAFHGVAVKYYGIVL